MLLIVLLIYLLLIAVSELLILPFWSVDGLKLALGRIPVLFVVAATSAYLVVYIFDSYSKEALSVIRSIISPKGIRLWSLTTLVVAVGSLIAPVVMIGEFPDTLAIHTLLPIAAVSILFVMGVDWRTQTLSSSEESTELPEPAIPVPDVEVIKQVDDPGNDYISPAPTEDINEGGVVEDDNAQHLEDGGLIPDSADSITDSESELTREYKWMCDDNEYSAELQLSRSRYEESRSIARNLNVAEWSEVYVSHGITDEIRHLSSHMINLGKGFGSYREVSVVLSFVQSAITYEAEEIEYPKYPIETLVDGSGDCEDYSILAASILKCMDYEVALIILEDHVALGIGGATDLPGAFIEHNDRRYFYCEMTAKGWRIGDISDAYRAAKCTVSPVIAPPPRIVIPDDQGNHA